MGGGRAGAASYPAGDTGCGGWGLRVEDTLRLPPALQRAGHFRFALGASFQLQQPTAQRTAAGDYSIPLAAGQTEITLQYSGKLTSTQDCAWLTQACVLLGQDGLYVDGGSGWYPQVEGVLHTFELQVELPTGWVSLSQGEQTATGWREMQPQDSLYLLAGPFHVYQQDSPHAKVLVYLHQADAALAQRYLQASAQYLAEYSDLLGAYPYAKFAVVESFWETGWGMPSFILLGPKVLRLPFILHTSLPHEILHNWWGNGVYVDARHGNWSEGLTAYLADHWHKDKRGEGVEHRRSTLQAYATFVSQHNDFALSTFRSRHDDATQAVGYGKAMMLFHMLSRQLGDNAFFAGLRDFYQRYRFRPASFHDLLDSWQVDAAWRKAWLERAGAPRLALAGHRLEADGTGQRLHLTLRQQQAGEAFPLSVPLVVRFADGKEQQETLDMTQAEQAFSITLPAAPQQMAVDPAFEVFRVPDPQELPANVGALFGTASKVYVLPRKADARLTAAWQGWLDSLHAAGKTVTVQYDDAPLPDSATVVLLGADNAALQGLLERAGVPFRLTEAAYTLNGANYTCGLHSLALALRAGTQTLVLLDASTPEGWTKLLAKLPHYRKYSYVVFNSATGENVAKGFWEVQDSPLAVKWEGK